MIMEDFEFIAAEQGWDYDSQIIHLKGFIERLGASKDLGRYAKQIAAEENAEFAKLFGGEGGCT
jgi:hypothetical protein